MFTLEIGGRAIAVTDADHDEAHALLQSDEFKDDLKRLEGDGGPLWDGRSPLTVRPATDDEIAEFEQIEDDEDSEGDLADPLSDEDEDGPLIMFLVPINASDDEEDE
jgi:hypothetical protein